MSKLSRPILLLLLIITAVRLSAAELSAQEKFLRYRSLAEEAATLEQSGKYSQAGKQYVRAAKYCDERRELSRLKHNAAHCYLLSGKLNRSQDLYNELLNEFQLYIPYDEITAQMRRLAECYELGRGTFLGITDPDTACKIYRKIILETPAVHISKADRLKLAELLEGKGSPEEAANVYIEAIKKSPADPDLRLRLATLLLRLSQRGHGDSDGSQLRGAIREAKAFLRLASPDDPGCSAANDILRQADEGLADRLLEQAEYFLRKRSYRPEASRRYLSEILLKYPDTPAAAKAREIQSKLPSQE